MFRRRIFQAHQPQSLARFCDREGIDIGIEQFGDAEIEDLHTPLFGYQDVFRFQVPVNDQILMRVLNGIANLLEQFKPLVEGKMVSVAIFRDRFALHIFHHQIGNAIFAHPAFYEAGDIGMMQAGQDLLLQFEPAHVFTGVQVPVHDFQGAGLANLRAGPFSFVDAGHTAPAQ